jgi:hypothetical protein
MQNALHPQQQVRIRTVIKLRAQKRKQTHSEIVRRGLTLRDFPESCVKVGWDEVGGSGDAEGHVVEELKGGGQVEIVLLVRGVLRVGCEA